MKQCSMRIALLGIFVLLAAGCDNIIYIHKPQRPYTEGIYVRVNQNGYAKNGEKTAIIGSSEDLEGFNFYITDELATTVYYTGTIGGPRGAVGTPFKENYTCDFSGFYESVPLKKYRIMVKGPNQEREYFSPTFRIVDNTCTDNNNAFINALSSILFFFRTQRCGNTDPLLHGACHTYETNNKNSLGQTVDTSGGWHDAGDYIKFMSTTTHTAYELLIAYDYATMYKFNAATLVDSSPANGIPDVLEEAKIGIDWIMKMTGEVGNPNGRLYCQVSGENDHEGWRMPEEDKATTDPNSCAYRGLYEGFGDNLLGRSVAVLAVAYRCFKDNPAYMGYADALLARAEALYAKKDEYQRLQHSIPQDYYQEWDGQEGTEPSFWMDDLVLASAELFMATEDSLYKTYAEDTVRSLVRDDISWYSSDYLAFAACLRAEIEIDYCRQKMESVLNEKLVKLAIDPYFMCSGYTWGTCALIGADIQKAIMYGCLTGNEQYKPVIVNLLDYMQGRNNWGISFITGVGVNYARNPHSQVNDKTSGGQKGAVVGGPAIKTEHDAVPEIKISSLADQYRDFQCEIVYFDAMKDYFCNEVAIDYAAPFVFAFMYMVDRMMKE